MNIDLKLRKLVLALVVSAIYLCLNADEKAKDKIVTEVNGEPIYESEIASPVKKTSVFDMVTDQIRNIRLERIKQARRIAQSLKARKIEVSKAEIDRKIENLEKYPPKPDCTCCNYSTLDGFMQAKYYDMKEMRGEISNMIGIRKYLDKYPESDNQNEKDKAEHILMQKEYIRLSLCFNTFQNIEQQSGPRKARD